jgi:hypothetical protein
MLKFEASKKVVGLLNGVSEEYGPVVAMMNAIEESTTENLDELQDWLDALKSGKKIVNPISPREELKKEYDAIMHEISLNKVGYYDGKKNGIEAAIEIIAKDHPDVADWLKDGDSNA